MYFHYKFICLRNKYFKYVMSILMLQINVWSLSNFSGDKSVKNIEYTKTKNLFFIKKKKNVIIWQNQWFCDEQHLENNLLGNLFHELFKLLFSLFWMQHFGPMNFLAIVKYFNWCSINSWFLYLECSWIHLNKAVLKCKGSNHCLFVTCSCFRLLFLLYDMKV